MSLLIGHEPDTSYGKPYNYHSTSDDKSDNEMSFSIPRLVIKDVNDSIVVASEDHNLFKLQQTDSVQKYNRETVDFCKYNSVQKPKTAACPYSTKRGSKHTTGVKKLMNDSQEVTVENFG